MTLIEEGYRNAIRVIRICDTPKGLYASGTPEGYTSVWSRDSNITFLGASLVGKEFKKSFLRTLEVLVKFQSPRGQIANAIGLYDPLYRSQISYNTIDSTLWFVIGEHIYAKAYGDMTLLRKHHRAIDKSLTWLSFQDVSEEHLLAQQPTTDWQDAFPHKYGRTINTQALYYAVLRMTGDDKEADLVRKLTNGSSRPHLALWSKKLGYYLPWTWKDHDGDREEDHWFDTLGNLLAIVVGLTDPPQARSILSYIDKTKINRPYPLKCMYPPIYPRSKLWKSYFLKSDARKPYHYLNGGIWPFLGGFYVAALVKTKQLEKAKHELEFLAKAVKQGKKLEWEFNEWLDGRTGRPMGGVYQAWSAGAYLFAYECFKHKSVPFF